MLSVGQILDDTYRLQRLVAQGGMGVVYEATHARLAGRYAIKVLASRPAESAEGFGQFDREARNTSLLQHPNVVQVIDHNTAPDGTEYLVMEYLAGESLSQRLAREGRLPLDAVVDIVGQIAAGLAAAHAHGIVHRDLKPDNVVLVPVAGRQTDLVKILDFGISKRQGSLEMAGLVCGTPQYMAPEQVDGRILDVNASTDQFALAVIAQELLTGRNPFAADSIVATFARVTTDEPASVGLGEAVDAVLARALAKSSGARFRSVTDFAEAFRAAALAWGRANPPQATVPAPGGTAPNLAGKPRVRRRGGRMALSAAALAIAVFFVADRAPTAPGRPESRPVPPAEFVLQGKAPGVVAPQPEPALIEQPVGAPQRASLTANARKPVRIGRSSRATAPRTRSAVAVDEDATMPLTEIAAQSPDP